MRPLAATPCRPLSAPRAPFNVKNGPAGGSRRPARPAATDPARIGKISLARSAQALSPRARAPGAGPEGAGSLWLPSLAARARARARGSQEILAPEPAAPFSEDFPCPTCADFPLPPAAAACRYPLFRRKGPIPPSAHLWFYAHLLTPNTARQGVAGQRPAAAPNSRGARPPSAPWREIWQDLVASSPQATPLWCPLAPSGSPLPPAFGCPLRRAPFNAEDGPAGGSRSAGGRPRPFGATAGRSRPRRENR